jgi:hypothetical protein
VHEAGRVGTVDVDGSEDLGVGAWGGLGSGNNVGCAELGILKEKPGLWGEWRDVSVDAFVYSRAG